MYNMFMDMHTHVRMDMCLDMCTIPIPRCEDPTPEDSALLLGTTYVYF